MENEEKKISRKWIITLWSAVNLSLIIISALFAAFLSYELPGWLGTIGSILAGVIGGYLGVNVWQKKKNNPEEKK